jgi:hypothetical protein
MKVYERMLKNEKVIFILIVVIITMPFFILNLLQKSETKSSDTQDWWKAKEAHSPFKKKEVRSLSKQDGDTTQTIEYATYPVELTAEQEAQYYGRHPEYEAWDAAYVGEVLHRYPAGWGYFGFTEMLTSDDSGANSGTVVSMHLVRTKDEYDDIWEYEKTLNAPIGYEIPYTGWHYTKTAEFQTITGMKVSKYKEDNGKQIRQAFIIEQPDDWYLKISVNGMNYDVYNSKKDVIDQIVKSMIYVPYEYR